MGEVAPRSRLRRAIRRAHGIVAMNVGRSGSMAPLSENWGYDRGKPIDRHYIEAFLAGHSADVKGRVLEVSEDTYSKRFGGPRVTHQDILNVDASNPAATIVGDLVDPATLPTEQFDCIILTQTLHLLFDMPAAIAQIHRALAPGGVALITVPGITPLDREDWLDSWYWSLTGPALQHLLSGPFRPDNVDVVVYGNLYAATAFLHGASVQEISTRKLDIYDRAYPVTVAARAVK